MKSVRVSVRILMLSLPFLVLSLPNGDEPTLFGDEPTRFGVHILFQFRPKMSRIVVFCITGAIETLYWKWKFCPK